MSNFITNAELRIEAERLCDENDQLKAENAKLRKTATMLAGARTDLLAENAKLRELATMLHRCASGSLKDLAPSCLCEDVDGCGMDCTENGEKCCMELLERRMRELGVETK